MVIIVGNRHYDPNSNPEQDYFSHSISTLKDSLNLPWQLVYEKENFIQTLDSTKNWHFVTLCVCVCVCIWTYSFTPLWKYDSFRIIFQVLFQSKKIFNATFLNIKVIEEVEFIPRYMRETDSQ